MAKGTRKIKRNPKWDFAIGTTSRVPNRPGYHYLMMDIDSNLNAELPYVLKRLGASLVVMQPTNKGWHIYTNLTYSWKQLFHLMPSLTDRKWLEIGKKRGYLFLADKAQITFPWPVERMVLHYNGEKEGDAR